MYLFVTDETNLEPSSESMFFIYGGLAFPVDVLTQFNKEISNIRKEAGYENGDKLKFDTRVRPTHVSIQSATEAKSRVVDLCLALNSKLIIYVIHHEIAKDQSIHIRVTYGINSVLKSFNDFLYENRDYGMFIADTLPIENANQFLCEKFTRGLIYPDKTKSLNRINLYAQTSINMSHIASATDIVLGSFRYCINNPKNPNAASTMIKKIAEMMWGTKNGDDYDVFEKGFILRPLLSKISSVYKPKYDELIEHLNELLDKKK